MKIHHHLQGSTTSLRQDRVKTTGQRTTIMSLRQDPSLENSLNQGQRRVRTITISQRRSQEITAALSLVQHLGTIVHHQVHQRLDILQVTHQHLHAALHKEDNLTKLTRS
jgi:hypothetical protein